MKECLKKFANLFEENSVLRGIRLYQDDAITNVKKVGNAYVFDVEGITDDYKTSITFDKNKDKIKDYFCTCMHFDSGHLCKHLYASLLKLNDILDFEEMNHDLFAKENVSPINEEENSEIKDETNNDNKKIKTEISNKDLASFRIYCNSYDFNQNSMEKFLSQFDLSSHELATLFLMIRKPKPMEIFLNHFEDKLDSEFFKEIKLDLFPMSTPLKTLVTFLIKHSNMIQYLDDNSLIELFTRHRVAQDQDRITLFFLCLSLNQKRAINAFFLEPSNILNFFQSIAFVNYMKTSMTKEECLSELNTKIKNCKLSRIEAAFLYPYFDESTKILYDDFFKKHFSATDREYYYISNFDYEREYLVGLPLNRAFYSLLKKQTTQDLTLYDLRVLYYLRESLFTGENKLIFAKRFRQLALALFRIKYIDNTKIYCCMSIILEYADDISIIKDLLNKATIYFSNVINYFDCSNPEILDLYSKIESKYVTKENRIIHEYN